MTSDPRFRLNVEDRLGGLSVVASIDILIMARQMAMEIAERSIDSEADPKTTKPGSNSTELSVVHNFDDSDLLSSTSDTTDPVAHTIATYNDHSAGPPGLVVGHANSMLQIEFAGHGPLSLSAPASLSVVLRAITDLPAQWTMDGGARAESGHHHGAHVALSNAGVVIPPDYQFSATATNAHISAAIPASVSEMQNPSFSPSASNESNGRDDTYTKNSLSPTNLSHIAFPTFSQPVSQVTQAFVSASILDDRIHGLISPNLTDSDFTRSSILSDVNSQSLAPSVGSTMGASTLIFSESATQAYLEISGSLSPSHNGLILQPGTLTSPSLITTTNLSSGALLSTDTHISVIAPAALGSIISVVTIPLNTTDSHPDLPLTSIFVPLPASVNQELLITADPAHGLASAPALPDPAPLPDPAAPVAADPAAAATADPAHGLASAPALPDPAPLHNQRQSASLMPHFDNGSHASDEQAPQQTTGPGVAQAGLNIAADATELKHSTSTYNAAGHEVAEVPKQVYITIAPVSPGEQTIQTAPELRHESAFRESGSSHSMGMTSAEGPVSVENSMKLLPSDFEARIASQQPEPTKQQFSQLHNHFIDHRLSSVVQEREGQDGSVAPHNVAYSTAPDLSYGPSGAGVSPQMASYLLSFLDRLDAQPNLNQTDQSTHLLLDVGHMMNHHGNPTSSTDHQTSNSETSHVRDNDVYYTNNPGHTTHIDLVPFHSFDHHG